MIGTARVARRRGPGGGFTLFFIPVIPLNSVGWFVRCPVCRTRYAADVLGQPSRG